MHVAIIGAGAAGLASARHVIGSGFTCDVFEMAPALGGTWHYTDDVGTDSYGFPVYSAMYKGLRTNLPKEIMGFPDFPIPEQNKSYLTQAEVFDFLNLYADHFNLRSSIKFNTMVVDVSPKENNKWEVSVIDKPTRKQITKIYDAVMICNGHYNDPIIPKMDGMEKFKGKIDHSHNYRSPEMYKDQQVLVVGAGPSGLDLTLHISAVAEYVVLSHHCEEANATQYPENVQKKPDIARFVGDNEVEFSDGSCCRFDTILFCTGYRYSFPFLNESCGITVKNNHIQPLYKHMINIEKPTMCFIGIPFNVCAFQMFDLQARYFCKYLSGSMQLPTKEEMRMHTKKDLEMRLERGYTERQAHIMGEFQGAYYKDLAADAKTDPIAPVIIKLRELSVKRLYDDLLNFREDRYKIIDENNYIKVQ